MVEHAPVIWNGARPVSVLAAGGTIGMAGTERSGATPALDAAALVAAAGVQDVTAQTVLGLPGAHLSLPDALTVVQAAVDEAAAGRGVVVTTGTDTLEELAVLCDLLHDAEAAVVFTGAIRPASTPGADGPGNLVDAVAVAAAAPAGCFVVFGGEVHAAAEARKTDSTGPRAFASPRTGPLGFVSEGRLDLVARPPARGPALRVASLDGLRVPIVPTFLGDDGALLRAAAAPAPAPAPDGIVLVALGAGHVPPPVLDALADVVAGGLPVAVTVRPERGALLHETYAFRGAEPDVRATGAIPAGGASPQAARMRLLAALGAGLDRPGVIAVVTTDS